MKIAIVVAYDKNRGIGTGGDLPWGRSLPADLAHFKELTTGGAVVMGRKTYESIGGRPLPNRKNIVLSTGEVVGAIGAKNFAQALQLASEEPNQDIFVIGGERVFAEALPEVDTIYATEVDYSFSNADVFFPQINVNQWEETSRTSQKANEQNRYSFDFVEYRRK